MYTQEFDPDPSGPAIPPEQAARSLPWRTLEVFRAVLMRGYEAARAAALAARTFGPLNTARAWLAGPLYRLRRAVEWVRGRTGLPATGALGVAAFALSDTGRQMAARGRTALSVMAAKAITVVGRFLVRHPLPAPVQSALSRAGQVAGRAVRPVWALALQARDLVARVGVTAKRSSTALATAAVTKAAVPTVPVVLALGAGVTAAALLTVRGQVEPVEPLDPHDGPDDDPTAPAAALPTADAQTAYASMEHLATVLPKIKQAVREAVAAGDKDALREARRLLAACRARTVELKKASAALRAGDLSEELIPVLDDIDALVAEMTAEWTALGQQLRDATGNRGSRRAAASQARRQWSPTAAEAL